MVRRRRAVHALSLLPDILLSFSGKRRWRFPLLRAVPRSSAITLASTMAGKILAASISRDTIGAAAPNGTDIIEIVSEGYQKKVVVDLSALERVPKNCGTVSLVAGMAEAARKKGFAVSGFQAYVSTKVISAAGVSSSASFEMLICSIINYFFNNGKISYADYAKIGQYAENHFSGIRPPA